MPARIGSPVDGPLYPVRGVAHDARQALRHLVVVLAHPLLIGRGIHAFLQCRDHVPQFHRILPHPPASSERTRGMTAFWRRSMVVSIRPSRATGYTTISAMPRAGERNTTG